MSLECMVFLRIAVCTERDAYAVSSEGRGCTRGSTRGSGALVNLCFSMEAVVSQVRRFL